MDMYNIIFSANNIYNSSLSLINSNSANYNLKCDIDCINIHLNRKQIEGIISLCYYYSPISFLYYKISFILLY